MIVSFRAYGIPRSAGSKTTGVRKDGTRYVRAAGKYEKGWKETVRKAAETAVDFHGRHAFNFEEFTGPLELRILFYVPRPKKHFRSNGAVKLDAPPHPASKPDIDKLARAVCDAIQGVVLKNDGQVVKLKAEKRYIGSAGLPGASIEVAQLLP